MRRAALTCLVLICFALYSFNARHPDEAHPVVQTPSQPAPSGGQSGNSGTSSSPAPTASATSYKDGNYTGSTEDAFYGYVQVRVSIQNGKLTDVKFLQYPNDRSTSVYINSQAMPLLKQEAIAAQSASVDTVSGATDTSQAFVQSLTNALNAAKNS